MNHDQDMNTLSNSELELLEQLAVGRILKMASRKHRPGDEEQYEKCRELIRGAKKILSRRQIGNFIVDKNVNGMYIVNARQ